MAIGRIIRRWPIGTNPSACRRRLSGPRFRTTTARPPITFTYDTLNRLATKALPSEPTVTYAYDLASRPIGVSDTSAAIASAMPLSGGTMRFAATASYDQLNEPLGMSWTPAPAQATPTLIADGRSAVVRR